MEDNTESTETTSEVASTAQKTQVARLIHSSALSAAENKALKEGTGNASKAKPTLGPGSK